MNDSQVLAALPERLLLTGLVLVAVLAALALMRLGWLRRARRQHDVAPPASPPDLPPEHGETDVSDIAARYLGANRDGDWLDRIVVHGLGVPSAALVSVRADSAPGGVWIVRDGAPDLYLPADGVVAARHDRAAGGRAVEQDALVVVQWAHGSTLLEIGLRVRDADSAERLRRAVESLAASPAIGGRR